MPVVNKLRIYLIGNHKQIVGLNDFCDGFQIFPAHDGAGRIVRIGEDQRLCAGRDGFLQTFGSEAEIVFFQGFHPDGGAAGKNDAGGIGNIAGLRNKNLVPRGGEGPEGDIDGLGGADGDDDLGRRIVRQAIAAGKIEGDLIPQLGETPVGGILGFAVYQGIDGGIPDMIGRFEIRLADAEGDRILHGGGQVEKAADTAGWNRGDARVQKTFGAHGEITSL